MDGSRQLNQNENEEQIRHATDCTLRPIAGDTGHGGSKGNFLQVRNTLTDLLVPLTAPEEG